MLGTEKTSVQNPLIKYAVEAGWKYLSPDEALRLRRGQAGLVSTVSSPRWCCVLTRCVPWSG